MEEITNLLKRQAEIERRMFQDSLDRARRATVEAAKRGDLLSAPLHASIYRRELEPLIRVIDEWFAGARSRIGGPRPALFALCETLDTALLAYVTISVALSFAASESSLAACTKAIGAALEDELRATDIKTQKPELFDWLMKRARRRGSGRDAIMANVNAQARHLELELPSWGVAEKIQVGTTLLDLLLRSTTVVEALHIPVGRNKFQWRLRLSSDCSDWMAGLPKAAALMSPGYYPMIIPPNKWESLEGGGYITNSVRRLRLVKRGFKGFAEELKTANLSTVYAAANAIQETAWKINTPIMETMRLAWDRGLSIGGLPTRDALELPPKPHDIDTNDEALRSWKSDARDIYEENATAQGKRFNVAKALELAGTYQDGPLYFPHQLDFRARLYPAPGILHPQGPDWAKSLLTFHKSDPLGNHGMEWLLIHGANLFGVDKVPFKERIEWAKARLGRASATAQWPFNDLWWTEADKPWQFLAWCNEIQNIKRGVYRGHSSLPIAMDGSCNGIQHYSAMLRDSVGGKATNLIPGEKPEDVYARVAEKTIELLSRMSGNWMAERWVALGIDRKMTKRQVMVLPYGGTFRSCLDYTRDAAKEKLGTDYKTAFGEEMGDATILLAKTIWEAIGEVVVAARQAMTFLQGLARVMTRHKLPLTWRTPSGFVVTQAYQDFRQVLIKTHFRGSTVRLVDNIGTGLNASKQALSLPPNFVHSYDAAALAITTEEAGKLGIHSLAMIHDSYGTTAGKTEELAAILRKSFVQMYEGCDPLNDIFERCRQQLPPGTELPALPTLGTLDIQAVRSSPYFFA